MARGCSLEKHRQHESCIDCEEVDFIKVDADNIAVLVFSTNEVLHSILRVHGWEIRLVVDDLIKIVDA